MIFIAIRDVVANGILVARFTDIYVKLIMYLH
jgi:hypothetical protein